jgi:hypothetical protein
MTTLNAATVFRDYVTDGVPGSGNNPPAKSDIRQLLGSYEASLQGFRIQTFETLTQAAAATIVGADIVVTLGRNILWDNGGASYIPIASSTAAAWRFQSADGQWWAILNRTVTPEMFGCFTGGADCTAGFTAIASWMASSAPSGVVINFLAGAVYQIWPAGNATGILCDLTSVVGLTVNFNGAKIATNQVTFASFSVLFYLEHSENITINDLWYQQTGLTTLNANNGCYGVYISAASVPWTRNVIVNNIQMTCALGGVRAQAAIVSGHPVEAGVSNIQITNGDFDTVYYPLSFAWAGDDVTATGIHTHNCGRSYFVYNVSNHSVDLISDGGGPFNDVLLKLYADPTLSSGRNTLSNIRVKYKNFGRTNATTSGSLTNLSFQQNVAAPNVSGAANNGSGLVRLAVDTTANMATGQTWFVNSVGGITGTTNGSNWVVTVIDGTHVDLQGSTFAGTYTSGGYMRVPAQIRNIDLALDVVGTSNQQPSAVLTYKLDSTAASDTVASGYTIENIKIGGVLRGYDYGIAAIDLFNNAGTDNTKSLGTFTGETVNNIILRDLVIAGASSSVTINATPISQNLVLENVVSGVPFTLTGSNGTNTRIKGCSGSGLVNHEAGTLTNDSAPAGAIGEYVESVVASGAAVALVNATAKTVTSISLTAGDWDIDCVGYFLPAATTSMTNYVLSISGTTNTVDLTPGKFAQNVFAAIVTAGVPLTDKIPPYRLSLSGTTAVFLVAQSAFTVSTESAYGIIRARRIR